MIALLLLAWSWELQFDPEYPLYTRVDCKRPGAIVVLGPDDMGIPNQKLYMLRYGAFKAPKFTPDGYHIQEHCIVA